MGRGRFIRRGQAGFSLLELLIVVSILSAAAYVALDAVDHDSSELRFNLTETRLKTIRRAIVGDPNITVNGSPMISGYAADVGQLPPCLNALSVQTSVCGPGLDDDINPPAYGPRVIDDTDGDGVADDGEAVYLMFGWNGPYVTGLNGTLQDAWGNSGTAFAATAGDPDVEAGWIVTPGAATFDVSSAGRDRVSDADGGGGAFFDADETMVPIQSADFQVSLAGWTVSVDFTNLTAADVAVCIGLLGVSSTDEDQWAILPNSGAVATVTVGATQTISFTGVAGDLASIGKRTLLVFTPDTGTTCALSGTAIDLPATVFAQENVVLAPRITLADVGLSVSVGP